MHYVAFSELALSGVEYLAAGNGRVDRKQGQYVLELVAEAKCPAGLIESRPTPDAAGEGLVEHPAVEDQIGSWFGGMHLHCTEQVIPEHPGTLQSSPHVSGVMVFPGQLKGMFLIAPLPQHKVDLFNRAGEQIEVQLEDSAWILAG